MPWGIFRVQEGAGFTSMLQDKPKITRLQGIRKESNLVKPYKMYFEIHSDDFQSQNIVTIIVIAVCRLLSAVPVILLLWTGSSLRLADGMHVIKSSSCLSSAYMIMVCRGPLERIKFLFLCDFFQCTVESLENKEVQR